MRTIRHAEGVLEVAAQKNGMRRLTARPNSASLFVRSPSCETTYPDELIGAIVRAKGVSYACDEILRDTDPQYIEQHTRTTLFSFMPKEAFVRKRLLDFGCGCGASTMILARALPKTKIVGIELEQNNLDVARLRAKHYGAHTVTFLKSPSGDALPPNLGLFDFIFLPAVYEHLLPNERARLSGQWWELLKPGGVLFIDETPHRWFPAETHTTGLPLINYLPNALTAWVARWASARNLKRDSWETLLRKGIRGSTPREVLRRIRDAGGTPCLLAPIGRMHNPVDVWIEGYARNATGKTGSAKRVLASFLKILYALTGIALVPYLSIAIKKEL